MTTPVPDILARIVEHKRREIIALAPQLSAFEKAAAKREPRSFTAALKMSPPSVIAEIKQASPSKGVLIDGFDPAAIATLYQRGGAAALSVLTDEQFFRGSLDDLQAARSATGIPVLRKDFTIAPVQIAQAAAAGADTILLIVAVLTDRQLRDFREYAELLRLDALVEVHDQEELDRATASGARIIGVNNRDLRTFDVRLETSLDLAERIPDGVVKVSESGIHSGADVRRLTAAGFSAFLVGEHLMKSGDAARAIRELRQ